MTVLYPADCWQRQMEAGAFYIKGITLQKKAPVLEVPPPSGAASDAAETDRPKGFIKLLFHPEDWLIHTLRHERLSDMEGATTLNDNTIDVRICV